MVGVRYIWMYIHTDGWTGVMLNALASVMAWRGDKKVHYFIMLKFVL